MSQGVQQEEEGVSRVKKREGERDMTHSLLPVSVAALSGRYPPSNTITGVMSYLSSMFTLFMQYLMNGLYTLSITGT